MKRLLLDFKELPKIGFAHHFMREGYNHTYITKDNSFEIVYVKKGTITVDMGNVRIVADEGSIFLLFRHFPIRISSNKDSLHAHCTVQLIMKHSMSLIDDDEPIPEDFAGLVLPLCVSAGEENDRIKKELYSIVSDISISREKNGLSASVTAVGILKALASLHKFENGGPSLISYKIKQYVAEHLNEQILLSDIALQLKKTPNYLNSVFKNANGINVHQYIIREKIKALCELMLNKGLSFKVSCESVGIYDISYGYRLFKKHTGVTPSEYCSGNRIDYLPSNKE